MTLASIARPAFAALVLIPTVALAQDASRPLGAAGTVTLSRTEYDRLLDLANRKPSPPDVPPVAAALTRADISVRIDGPVARATMLVEGQVFRSGVVKVPLINGATLLDARAENRPLPVVAEGDLHVAFLPGPTTFAATLEVGTPLSFTPGRGTFVLPVPIAGTATAVITVPGDQTDIHLSRGIVLRRSSANGRTTIDATLDPGTPTEVWWSTRDSAPTQPNARNAQVLSEVKTLVTIGEADVRLLTLLDITVVQGDPSQMEVALPAGYEMISASGASLERTENRSDHVTLFVTNPAQRRHQFLISLERQNNGGSFKLETSFPSITAARRETGEVAVEGVGTLEIAPATVPGLRRIDVREIDPALASATRQSLSAAFRYQRTADAPPTLTMDVRRFPDAAVLAAVADRAIATTLVTAEGHALTEITLWMRNRAQPFMKVALPEGASLLSVEVGGSPASPVEGKDGSRVPLLRPGYRPDGPYSVSFVYLHAGTPFAKKGDMHMMLPKMDVPVNVLEWELFIPDRYRVDRFDGTMLAADLFESVTLHGRYGSGSGVGTGSGVGAAAPSPMTATAGQIVGRVVDSTGSVIPGVTVTVQGGGQRQQVVTDASGTYALSHLPSGPLVVEAQMSGFTSVRRSVVFDQRPRQVDMSMQVGGLSETLTVSAEAPVIDTRTTETGATIRMDPTRNAAQEQAQAKARQADTTPSVNVQNLQRRASGVLPVRMEVPRAGTSHRFLKPLVIDEATVVSFRYKRR
jgi:Carboxypeptidase regulatory-like domain